jgi:hypothetical protein
MPFFRDGPAKDPIYANLTASPCSFIGEARDYVEELWESVKDYFDPSLPDRAAWNFHPCFWEIYLAAALLKLGLPVVPERSRRHKGNKGPDIQVGEVQAWIEAKVVEQGTGPDSVPDLRFDDAFEVPHREIKLRLSSALKDKREVYSDYLESGDVTESEPFIIAINAGLLPCVHLEQSLPRILGVLFPFGDEVAHFDLSSNRVTDTSFAYNPHLTKAAGARVTTSFFDQEESMGVSAVLYSAAGAESRPDREGKEFILIHNPNARAPIPRGLIPIGREGWVDAGRLTILAHEHDGR